MKAPEFQGHGWAIHNSDCVEGMYAMPEASIDLPDYESYLYKIIYNLSGLNKIGEIIEKMFLK